MANQSRPEEGSKHRRLPAAVSFAVNFTHDVVMLIGSDGTILFWNASAERQYGWKRQEVEGKNVHQLLQTRFPLPIENIRAQVSQTGHWEGEVIHLCRDRAPLAVQSRWVLAREQDPPVTMILEVNSDHAERKRVERRLRRIYDSNMIGVAFWNVQGDVTGANDYFLDLIGYSREELEAGKIKWRELTPPEYREITERQLSEAKATGSPRRYEKEYIRKDGTRVPVLIGLASIEGSPGEGLSCIVDLSERERIAAQLRTAQDTARALSTPVLQVRDRLLIVPMIGVIDTVRAKQLTAQLLASIRGNRARVVVLDVTGVPEVDAAVANNLVQTVQAARLLGAELILTGISREISQTLVGLGMKFSEMHVMGDLQSGIEEAEAMLGYQTVPRARRKRQIA